MCDPTYKREVKNENPGTTSLFTKEGGNNNEHVFLQTAKAYIYPSDDSQNNAFVRLIIDGGSQLTYIREDVSRKLRLKILGTRKLSVMPFGSEKRSAPQLYNVVELKLISQYSNEPNLMKAISVPEICFDSFQTPNVDHPIISTLEMADISISSAPVTAKISLLIGADYYWKIVTGEFIRLTESLAALNTKLGWTLQGPTTNDFTNVNTAVVSSLHVQVFDEKRDEDMKQFWDLETIGIGDKLKQNNFTDNFIEKKIVLKNDRFEVMLPWKDDCAVDSNYNGALARMKNLTFRLSKNARLLEYDQTVRELIDNNIAEKAPSEPSMGKTYYMPHRPVYREDKTTTKIRVVFDASAHANGLPSLNELLHTGENLVQDLMNVLLNFRVGKIAVVADIEKAFLQIRLATCERDCHRFLWYESPITDVNNLPPVQEYRMTRVTFGVTSSPFLLSATLKKLFILESALFQETARRLTQSFYVDDMVSTVNSYKDAIQLYQESKRILKVTGVDFAGPLYVYENDDKRKTYIMLLTCAVTRAILLELVLDLSTESCIRWFRRFIARRGVPAAFHSDNAMTFKRASLELNKLLYEILQSEKISDFTSNERIVWKFIVERAAWWGGFWERLVKSVKDCLKFALGKSRVSIDELQTMLTEVEATVNSRPLTYIDDDKDSLTALSPSSFLLSGQRQCLLPVVEDVKRESVLRQWKERQRVILKFWNSWSTDYLQQLRTAHTNSWLSLVRKFRVDDFVLLHDQGAPRLNWKMVRVTTVYPGRDGKVRACEVRLPSGAHLRRPVQLLYPLEIQDAAREDEDKIRTSGDREAGRTELSDPRAS